MAFVEVFVSLFAVLNWLPVTPIVLNMTGGLPRSQRRSLLRDAVLTASGVGLLFLLAGAPLLRGLGLQLCDLRIAGGVVLLVFATYDLLFSRQKRKEDTPETDVGVVPLGVPILLGPASMTALLVFAEIHGPLIAFLGFATNMALNVMLLSHMARLQNMVGAAVIRATGKAFGVILAAIAVSMLRIGIQDAVAGG